MRLAARQVSCLEHDSGISGGVLVVSVVNGELREVRRLREKVGQLWRLRIHPQHSTKAAHVCHLFEIEVPTMEHCYREDAIEIQDIREIGIHMRDLLLPHRLEPWNMFQIGMPHVL